MSRTFQIQMGFDLNSSVLTGTDPAQELYPLQNAVVDTTARSRPAWYTQFQAGDSVTFLFFDISYLQSRQPSPNFSYPDAMIEISDPDSGSAVWPFTVSPDVSEWVLNYQGETKSVVYSPNDEVYPSYRLSANIKGEPVGTFVFAEPPSGAAYGFGKLSARLSVSKNGASSRYNFVFDPEMIISRGGG